MTSRPSVYTIPPHRSFADALAAGLIARYGGEKTGLARGIILVPNNRAARAITDAFVRRSGGGLVHALPMIDADPFLVVNSDNLWTDGPEETFGLLASQWREEAMDALLLLVPFVRAHCHAGLGDFHLDAGNVLRRKEPGSGAPYVYTGIQMISKRLFEGDLPEGPFSTNILWDRAIAKGRCYGSVHQGLWFDVGAPPNITKAEEILGLACPGSAGC